MEELYNLEISDSTLKSMIEINPEIINMEKEDINNKIILLNNIGCSSTQITNIISSNPTYLSRSNDDINDLINTLNNYGFKTLNILFDSNPHILNLDSYEITYYIDNEISNGKNLDDIIDNLDSNPYLFNEI